MYYLETIKRIGEHIKNNTEISEEDKKQATALLGELARLLATY